MLLIRERWRKNKSKIKISGGGGGWKESWRTGEAFKRQTVASRLNKLDDKSISRLWFVSDGDHQSVRNLAQTTFLFPFLFFFCVWLTFSSTFSIFFLFFLFFLSLETVFPVLLNSSRYCTLSHALKWFNVYTVMPFQSERGHPNVIGNVYAWRKDRRGEVAGREGRLLSRNNELKLSVETIRCVPLSVSASSSHLSIFTYIYIFRPSLHTLSIINVYTNVCFRERKGNVWQNKIRGKNRKTIVRTRERKVDVKKDRVK